MMPRNGNATLFALALTIGATAGASAADRAKAPSHRDLSALLEPVLARHSIPALAAAVVQGDRTIGLGAVGVRRRGRPAKVTVNDRFHIGSCTKSMTATLCAMLVEEGKLSWTTTIGEVFGDLKPPMQPAYRTVTLEQLLTHRGGCPADLTADPLWARLWNHKGTATSARRALLRGVVSRPPEAPPGTKYVYSNAGYAIAGHMAEKVTGQRWETLLRKRLFRPLGMKSAGFGAPGVKKILSQPRGHTPEGKPVEPGPGADNPVAIGPAAIVHCSIGDWAKYVALHLRGAQKDGKLLRAKTFTKLHTPAAGSPTETKYAMGWLVFERPWGGGPVLMHNGTNGTWFAVTWIAPQRDFAVLVTCNQGGQRAERACDEAASALIQDHVNAAKNIPDKN